ncbi:glycosyltransferase [Frigoriflavimonas asaccharolytica]|uniref:UDP-galactopyranose mutase n=1 Tax=Frigoriflavimonas asaccharolytica TaxID=2735899 RepID=A0A8J8G846_9FLAO|nr:glycosyltransferase [Frigoriflavimonas asaccharolytica]NRS92918.1 UDP-galactopyranose mutase [Frigoriflavimonas asaccharolytica]
MENSWDKMEKLPEYDMLVFCHLRWDFVYQRPQHLITRLSKKYNILVVEEPIGRIENSENKPELFEITNSLHVLRPRINQLHELGSYLNEHIKQRTFQISWFYSAAFISVLESTEFETVVYDCMDELTLFKGASPELIEQENNLLSVADVVFTGGKSLFESKNKKHNNVHCFPSSVDINHFSGSQLNKVTKPKDLENITKKIVGYFGVIDERIDLDLIKETAQKMPNHDFVMIGPICKIEEEDLPRVENIHYLGMKSYEELPQYLHFFDFAMMPFALNDSTKFISPTKTLEYMSAMKPIISTKIKDVLRDYSDCVNLINGSEDFCNVIENPIETYKNQYKTILENTSWDKTAKSMINLIEKVTA